mgnify:CR=1 FL=1
MNVIWGFKHYGKSYINGLFRYNRHTVTQMQIGGMYVSHKWKYEGLDQHIIKYRRHVDEDNITTDIRVDRLSSDDLLHHDTDIGIRTQEFVEEDYLGYGNNNPPRPKFTTGVWKETGRELYPIYSDHGSVWENHFFNDLCDCDVFIPQTHPQLMSYRPFIEHFKTCRNIVPYKSDIVDICIQRINLFESKETNRYMNTNVKDVEDAYYTDKELVFSHLDFFVTGNRNVEQQLIDRGIPYEHLDLDTHDYKTLCENKIPRRHGEVGIPKDTERYKFATHMVEDYIKTRGLTDLRLSGRLHDKI